MTLAVDVLTSGGVCAAMEFILNDMLAVMGGGERAAVLLSFLVFVIPLMMMLGIGKNMVFGLIGGFIGHSILILLMGTGSSCVSLSASLGDYYAFAWVFQIIIGLATLMMFITYRRMT